MIYLFERIPINMSEKKGLIKSFSKLKLNAQDYQILEDVEMEKADFYMFFNKVHHDKNFLPSIEEIEQKKDYLVKVFELMKVCRKADYNIVQIYSPFLKKEKQKKLSGDIISSLLSEFIYSRYSYSLGTIRLLKKRIQNHMKNCFEESNFNQG